MAHADHLLVAAERRHLRDVRLLADVLAVVQRSVLNLEVDADRVEVLVVPVELQWRDAAVGTLVGRRGWSESGTLVGPGACLPSFSSVASRSAGVSGSLLDVLTSSLVLTSQEWEAVRRRRAMSTDDVETPSGRRRLGAINAERRKIAVFFF